MEQGFYAFGTMNWIHIGTPMPAREALLSDVRAMCEGLDDQLSVFKPDSEISRVSAGAGRAPVRVSPAVFGLLRRAKELSTLTGGAFDSTIRPAACLWDIGRAGQRVPTEAELHGVRRLVDSGLLRLDEAAQTAFLEREGQSLDLGGIAKGYAGDVVRRALLERGVDSALLNFGGTILTIGDRPDGTPWRVGIQNPLLPRGDSVGSVPLTQRALVTSGVNERFFRQGGVRYHHLLDPVTCAPARSGVLSVTAVGDCAMDLDGMTTALFVLGPERGIPLAVRSGLDVLYLTEDGGILATRGFARGKHRFSPGRTA
ncbi:MAG: FAD:protein FMN transferase [Oscillospiraceae bacterium]|nr:FAD:protein FMN transferase [Oscillospiraceae bacterium]